MSETFKTQMEKFLRNIEAVGKTCFSKKKQKKTCIIKNGRIQKYST